MSLTLATFSSGAAINATTIRGLLSQIETYVNEGIVAGDRASAWMRANHVYRPDFYGGSNPHTTLVSGESYFRQRGADDPLRSWWSYYLGDAGSTGAYLPIPGLSATVQVPESISSNALHRIRIFASFYAYEFGGIDGSMEESSNAAGYFTLIVDGSPQSGMTKPVWKGSSTSADQAYAFYPRKQISIMRDFTVSAGVHSYAIGVGPVDNTGDDTKHVVVAQGNLVIRYYCR